MIFSIVTLIMVHIISCLTTQATSARVAKGSKILANKCEPIKIPMCMDMPYNLTSFPNTMGHQNQVDVAVAAEQFSILRWTQCSPYLAFLLCSIYVPLCTFDFTTEPIPPCQEVCEAVLDDCQDIQNQLGFSWPAALDCQRYPPKDGGVCIAPEAEDWTSTTIQKDIIDDECRCTKIPKLRKRLYYRSNFKFALRGRSKQITVYGELTIINVLVQEVLKETTIKIHPNSEYTLWMNSSCLCPRIELGREYLLMGYEDTENQRLLHLSDSIAIEWHKKYADKILKWEKAAKKTDFSWPVAVSAPAAKQNDKKRKDRKKFFA